MRARYSVMDIKTLCLGVLSFGPGSSEDAITTHATDAHASSQGANDRHPCTTPPPEQRRALQQAERGENPSGG